MSISRKVRRKAQGRTPPAVKVGDLRGWLHAGPDFKQQEQGWFVSAEKKSATDIPVTIIPGHSGGGER